jgi:hypothetical protein
MGGGGRAVPEGTVTAFTAPGAGRVEIPFTQASALRLPGRPATLAIVASPRAPKLGEAQNDVPAPNLQLSVPVPAEITGFAALRGVHVDTQGQEGARPMVVTLPGGRTVYGTPVDLHFEASGETLDGRFTTTLYDNPFGKGAPVGRIDDGRFRAFPAVWRDLATPR